nr:MAG TPA: hypothetical protein [Bacteriophage sp.]
MRSYLFDISSRAPIEVVSIEKIRIRRNRLDRHRRPVVENYRSIGKFFVLIAFHAQYGVHGGTAVFGPDVDREQRVIRQAEPVCEALDLAMREDAPAIHKFADVTLSCHSLMLFLIEPEISVCREADRRERNQPYRRLRHLDLNRFVESYVAGRDDMDGAGSGGEDRDAPVGSYRYGLIVAEEQYIRLDAGRSERSTDEILRHVADQQARGVFDRHCSRHKVQRFQFRSGGDHLLAILFRINRGSGGIVGIAGCGIGGVCSLLRPLCGNIRGRGRLSGRLCCGVGVIGRCLGLFRCRFCRCFGLIRGIGGRLCLFCRIGSRLCALRCCVGCSGRFFRRRFHSIDNRLDIFERYLDTLVERIDTNSP